MATDHGRAARLQLLTATGIEAEAHLPYAGLHHLLRPVLSAMNRLPATQAGALSTTFGMNDGPSEPFMIALATLNLLTDVAAERPELLVASRVPAATGIAGKGAERHMLSAQHRVEVLSL